MKLNLNKALVMIITGLVFLILLAGGDLGDFQDAVDTAIPTYETIVVTETSTSIPTETATRTPTSTIAPTFTFAPTNTATATLTIEPTPTQENTPVPTPSATSIPSDKVCSLRATLTVNIRSCPDIGCTKQGTWSPTDSSNGYRTFSAFAVTRDYVWGYSAGGIAGWTAVYDFASQRWYASGTQTSLICKEIPDWPQDLDPPQPFARKIDGYHLIVGAQQVLLNYINHIGFIKATTHSDQIALMAKSFDPSIVIAYRSLYNMNGQIDGPTTSEWYNPYIYYSKTQPFWVAGFDYYEFINEWGGVPYSVIADFNIAILDLMGRDGYCGLAFSEGPGNPSFDAWSEYIRVLRWIDDHPCGVWPDGSIKYHGVSLHQAGHMPDSVPTTAGSYTKNPWIYNRLAMVNDILIANHQYDLHNFKGPIYLTEMGWEDYTIPNQHFTCEQVKLGLDLTRKDQLQLGLVDGMAIWNFRGPDGIWWVDLTPCLPVMYPN